MSEDLESDLARYYDQEAAARANRSPDPQRVARRDEFVALLAAERRATLVEVGIGPGRDAAALTACDTRVVFGVDLSVAHARLAHANGSHAAVASVYALPFADASCDAGWSMSTLVHVPNDRFDDAMRELGRVVRPGSPVGLGFWAAAVDTEEVNERDTIVPKRFFSRRTEDRLREMLGPHGRIERFDTWPGIGTTWTYQYVVVRTHE